MAHTFDIGIAGGGLSGSLIALTLARRRPELSVALVEAGDRIGGNHVWSYFASDIAEPDHSLLDPLVAAHWEGGYDVRFPGLSRTLPTPYRSVTSEKLHEAVHKFLPAGAIRLGCAITALDPRGMTLDDGTRIAAGGVIDARGASLAQLRHLRGGWQKFVGQMLRLDAPHGLVRPVVMDATVAQVDGYRFVYCLPFSATEIFVEDTYYSDTPVLHRAALSANIAAYAKTQGWAIRHVVREESGVLPVVTGGDFAGFMRTGAPDGAVAAGIRAGLFHPLTSYSLPDAVRFAAFLASIPDPAANAFAATGEYARRHWRKGGFYRNLAKMLFGAAAPQERYKVMRRFYGLDARLVERFYAGQSTGLDKVRVLAGIPPVPVARAALVMAGIGAPGPLQGPTEGTE